MQMVCWKTAKNCLCVLLAWDTFYRENWKKIWFCTAILLSATKWPLSSYIHNVPCQSEWGLPMKRKIGPTWCLLWSYSFLPLLPYSSQSPEIVTVEKPLYPLVLFPLNLSMHPHSLNLYYIFYYVILLLFLLFKYHCLHFPTTTFSHHTHPYFPPLLLPPRFGFVHGSFINVPWWHHPFFPPLSPSSLPSGYCQFVLYFNVSGYIWLTCLFWWLGSTYRWDLMVFVYH